MRKATELLILSGLLLSLLAVLYARERMAIPAATEASSVREGISLAEASVQPAPNTVLTEYHETAQPEETPEDFEPEPAWTPPPLREAAMVENTLPEELRRPAEHHGTVTELQYQTTDRVSEGTEPVQKDVCVYLPYGYDPEKQYDVLILLHCAGADHRFWLVEKRNYGTEEDPKLVLVPELLDKMIEEGYCRPLIVVSPCIYLYDRHQSAAGTGYDYIQFSREFGPDFLSFLAENYATYATDGSREALCEAREHFGVLGASFGAYASYLSVISDNFDLVAWYTFCGGGVIEPGYLVNHWAEAEAATGRSLPLRLLYICEGEHDDRAGPELSFRNLLYYGGPFTDDTVKFTLVSGWGHEDHSYLIGVYNSLQMFFRDH